MPAMFTSLDIRPYVPYALGILALCSIQPYASHPLTATPVHYAVAFPLLGWSLYCLFLNRGQETYRMLLLYAVWTLFCCLRGVFEISSSWVMNQYLHGIINTLAPVSALLFVSPAYTLRNLRLLNMVLLCSAVLLFGWNLRQEFYAFLLPPLFYIYLCLLHRIPGGWKWAVILGVALVCCSTENRSGVVKSAFSLICLMLAVIPRQLSLAVIRAVHPVIFLSVPVFLWLGMTGRWNVLNFISGTSPSDETALEMVTYADGEDSEGESDVLNDAYRVDTRTFIYVEMLESAVDHDHVLTGRTPARGYSSREFGLYRPNVTPGIDFDERFESEIGHLNVFNYLGAVGVLLLAAFYFQATWFGIWRSSNRYVPVLALSATWQWAYGWIENSYHMYMIDIAIFIMLGLSLSPVFRRMSDREFELWFRDVFDFPWRPCRWQAYSRLRTYSLLSSCK